MRVRKTPEQDLEETRAELEDARAKAAKWNGRVQELEESVTEKENTLILRAARTIATTPEGLRGLLDILHAAGPVTVTTPDADAVVRTGGTVAGQNPVQTADTPSIVGKEQADKEPPDRKEGQQDGE